MIHTSLHFHSAVPPCVTCCPYCRMNEVCNQCGKEDVTSLTGACTNGRCYECCGKVCVHRWK